jgi:hypothetical protein
MISRVTVILALFLCQGVCIAQTPSPSPATMEVVFLGTGGPRPAGRAASCNLVLVQGKARLLVDAGSGAFTRLGGPVTRHGTRLPIRSGDVHGLVKAIAGGQAPA